MKSTKEAVVPKKPSQKQIYDNRGLMAATYENKPDPKPFVELTI